MSAHEISEALNELSSDEQIKTNQWFFKTGPGQYGAGDRFMGVKVPDIRKVAKKFSDTALDELESLALSPVHEERLAALIIMVNQYERTRTAPQRKSIVEAYIRILDNGGINNWDLVDASAHKIIGHWYFDRDRTQLFDWADSGKLWHQRVSMMASYYFIRQNDFDDAFTLAERLLHHEHDLIHKIVGWMLREIGKRDQGREEAFLKIHQKTMPRTMLRYAIEKFSPEKRKKYLAGSA